ncbi:TonB-dependent receptor plug domain-containing protein [Sphingomonas sp.]|uniref:TonB-dependent receptor plug domain-containing protein n=1 Tax=Sphingomonas sp. TaxID=28214 RepID=UPI00180EF90D|nr:TonB-dependent receptor plug domain-containing protein [Sphingomonas sp.]MBA3512158.1 TonB-dependent receptor plug domain-containing protein [Sphingomonas sp.]
MNMLRNRRALLAGIALLAPVQTAAQTAAAPADPAIAPPPVPTPAGSKRIFTPADFARFAPKTAYDMLLQVPGFTIRGASQERGLGQASENVLINSQRSANKSGGAIDDLQKINAANVERIEIVDAASLGIAGLSGQVANVFVKAAAKSSGQFEWKPDVRAHFAKPNLYRGLLSYAGKTGPVDYTLSLQNQPGRGGFGGLIEIFDAGGNIIETRDEIFSAQFEHPKLTGKFALDGPGSSLGNLTLVYGPYWGPVHIRDRRDLVNGDDRRRTTRDSLKGYTIDISGDYAFALGPGRLKLIGVRRFDHEPLVTTQVTSFDSGAPDQGIRFSRDSRIGETIGRAEYGLKTGKNDWQLSLERAFNSLDQRGALSVLSADGEFVEVDFPEGTGKVTETRYEAIGTWSRPLSSKLDLQVAAGGEISKLARVDGDLPPRKFFRPKGSLTLGWRPSEGWDTSFKLRRRVGQISFYDFLAQPRLSQDREQAGNPDLVPPQSWEGEVEIGRELGRWGKTRLKTYYHRVEDIIDVIPIGEDGQGIGNLARATRFGMESTSTLLFDPIGWKGAKLDTTLGFQKTSVRDPLTGERRAISGTRDRWAEFSLRHDIPGSQIAWGADANHDHFAKHYFLTEVFRSWEGPWWLSAYVEHKAVRGMTVRATVINLLNARHRFDRTVFDGRRDENPVLFIQRNNQLIGPIFQLSVRGNF